MAVDDSLRRPLCKSPLDRLESMYLNQLADKLDAIACGAERIANRLLILIGI